MKKKQTEAVNGGKPLTFTQLQQALKTVLGKIEVRFDLIDKRFLAANIRIDNVEHRLGRLDSHIDDFLKRAEDNDREILFLGKQHDDLAKFCTQKIGYPTYGRNL